MSFPRDEAAYDGDTHQRNGLSRKIDRNWRGIVLTHRMPCIGDRASAARGPPTVYACVFAMGRIVGFRPFGRQPSHPSQTRGQQCYSERPPAARSAHMRRYIHVALTFARPSAARWPEVCDGLYRKLGHSSTAFQCAGVIRRGTDDTARRRACHHPTVVTDVRCVMPRQFFQCEVCMGECSV